MKCPYCKSENQHMMHCTNCGKNLLKYRESEIDRLTDEVEHFKSHYEAAQFNWKQTLDERGRLTAENGKLQSNLAALIVVLDQAIRPDVHNAIVAKLQARVEELEKVNSSLSGSIHTLGNELKAEQTRCSSSEAACVVLHKQISSLENQLQESQEAYQLLESENDVSVKIRTETLSNQIQNLKDKYQETSNTVQCVIKDNETCYARIADLENQLREAKRETKT